MQRLNRLLFVFIVSSLLLVSFLALYTSHEKRDFTSQKLTIVATTNIIADAVRVIVGDCAIVHCLMGPGIDPHLYRARESDVHALAAADIIFYNGLHLEGKMGHVLQGMHRFAHVVAVADSIDKNLLRISEFEDLYDPHIWFDVTLWMKVVGCIQKKLIEYDAENAEVYQKNGDEYSAQLALLHASLYKRMQDIPYQKRVLVTAHDAFGYFGRAYECEVVGLQGLSTDADINTKDIQLLADYIAHKKINAIFVESSIPQRALIAVQNAVHARGWSVAMGDELYSDSLGDETTYAHDYCGMMRYNVEVIACALVD